jgi:hypothetical protein
MKLTFKDYAKVWAFFLVPPAIIALSWWGLIAGPSWLRAIVTLLGF